MSLGRRRAVGAQAVLALALAAAGCAASLPRAYEEHRAAAERAYAAGRYEEAGEHWAQAAEAADRPKDQNEARYRAAASYDRGGRPKEAERLRRSLVEDHPEANRAPRAAYELALDALDRGDTAAALKALEDLIVRYPASAPVKLGLGHLVRHAEDSGGPPAVLAMLTRLEQRLVGGAGAGGGAGAAESPALEHVVYHRARAQEAAGDKAGARKTWLDLARRFPYPKGGYWDDALWHAARLAVELGQPKAALADLERMLAERESSHLSGSYERPRFSQARYRIAEIYRDELHDPKRARREFRRVLTEHDTSLLVDDALFQEARLAHAAGEGPAACKALELIAEHRPDSRFLPCAPRLCPGMEAPKDTTCRDYLVRELAP